MAKETILRGQVKFKEITFTESLSNRVLSIASDGTITDRPAIDTSTFLTGTLASGRVIIGNGSSVATAVNTASVGDIAADTTNGLTIKAGVIVNADVNNSAAIAYSKLALTGNVVNADINASAAIAYSKLNLALSIINADVAAAAAIARTKIASGTNYRLLANNNLGVMSENAAITPSMAVAADANGQLVASATSAAQLGYSSTLTGDIQTQLDNEITTKAVNALVKTPTITEHGFAITWNNTAGEYTLTDPVVQGLPLGGNTRQVLVKNTGADWDAAWVDLVLTDITDVSSSAADLNVLLGADTAGVTPTLLSYLVGTGSAIQLQLDDKQAKALPQNAIWVGNGSGIAAAVSGGTNGYVLTSVAGVPSWQPVSVGTPPGADTQMIFNDAGAFGVDTGFVYNKTTNTLTVVNLDSATTIGSAAIYRVGGTDVSVTDGGTGLSAIAARSLIVANSSNTYVALTPTAGQSIRINAGNTAWEAYTPTVGGDMVLASVQISTGKKQFNSTATDAGLTLGSIAGAPSVLSNGDMWHNSSTSYNMTRTNGLSRPMMVGTIGSDQVAFGDANNGVSGEAAFTYNSAGNVLTVDNIAVTTFLNVTAGTLLVTGQNNSTALIIEDDAGNDIITAGESGGARVIGFYGSTPAIKQTSGANLTNNVTSGGTNDQIDNYTDLVTYANDSANIRNNIYQLSRKLKQVNDALRAYGLLT